MRAPQSERGRTPGRLRRAMARRGVLGVAIRVPSEVVRWLNAAWNRLARHRNHVFVFDGPLHCGVYTTNLSVGRYGDPGLIPPALRIEIETLLGTEYLATTCWEMEHGAALWIAMVDARLAGLSMTRRGGYFRCWFVPLIEDDIVIFRNATLPSFRGQGVCPALMQHIIAGERQPHARVYVDCRVYNRASIRSIEKAGFRRIATRRPLSAKAALA